MLTVTTIDSESIWTGFFNDCGSPSFLQSWEWGEFESRCGYEIIRLGIYDNGKLLAVSLVLKIRAKRGSFLFIPHGPLVEVKSQNSKVKTILKELLKYLTAIGKKGNYSFIRIAPTLLDNPENLKIFSSLGFTKAPIYMHAERLWVLDLNKSEEELLAGMRKTTRYLIKKAAREGVIIEKRDDDKVTDDFWKLYETTADRESFVPFSKQFIKYEYETFKKTGNALFFFGKIHPSKINRTGLLASALIIFTESTAFYHQGASIHTKIPVTYLEQWEAIREAKKRGCRYYNFWGILQAGRTPKNWSGLTLFKQGFGGRQVDYLPTQDYILSPKYYFTAAYEKFLAWRRGV